MLVSRFEIKEDLNTKLLAGGTALFLALTVAKGINAEYASAATEQGGTTAAHTGGVSPGKNTGGISSGAPHRHPSHRPHHSGGFEAGSSTGGVSAN